MNTRGIIGIVLLSSVAGGLIVLLGLMALLSRPGLWRQYGPGPATPTSLGDSRQQWLDGLSRLAGARAPEGMNFVFAAQASRPSVVHIKTSMRAAQGRSAEEAYRHFFDERLRDYHQFSPPPSGEASGSGVIISPDGYIVTNNHVVEGAGRIQVVLDNRRQFIAELVGTDPTTDLALLRIDARDLPHATLGNSDSLEIGEWVLAVGNPFELTSTVTAGIVSAKARNINILSQGRGASMAVESFIQTDAAVNPGNSGGALVNLRGQLIGINTAIASSTGVYSGYSFAIPSTLVRKVIDDLLKYGEVQRALLGISIRDVDADLAAEHQFPDTRGVYVAGVADRSAAGQAGVREGDVILSVNDVEVNTVSALQEYIARYRPGDKVQMTLARAGARQDVTVVLRSAAGADKIVRQAPRRAMSLSRLGGQIRTLSPEDKARLSLTGGVEVVAIEEGGRLAEAGMEPGFIITHLDKKPVLTPEDLARLASRARGGVLIEGVYPDGQPGYFALGLR